MVIRCVPILMMNDFIRCQISSNDGFDNEPMFHDVAFAISKRMIRNATGFVLRLASVADNAAFHRFAGFVFSGTLKTTKPLLSASSAVAIRPAFKALVYLRFAPSLPEIAIARAKLAGRLTPILWMKRRLAVFARKAYGFVSHGRSVPRHPRSSKEITPKYCEIAVNRLRQRVLNFEEAVQ